MNAAVQAVPDVSIRPCGLSLDTVSPTRGPLINQCAAAGGVCRGAALESPRASRGERGSCEAVCLRGVIFDADGTLLDSMPLWLHAGEKYLASIGVEAENNLSSIIRDMGMEESADYLIAHYNIKAQDGSPASRETVIKTVYKIVQNGYTKEVPLKRGVKEALKALDDIKVPYAIATSTDRHLLQSAFKRLDLNVPSDMIFTCSEMHTTKDAPDIYLAAMKRLYKCIDTPLPAPHSPSPASFIVFEDTLRNAKTALAAGFFVTGVLDDGAEEDWEEMRRVCNMTIHDFTQVHWY